MTAPSTPESLPPHKNRLVRLAVLIALVGIAAAVGAAVWVYHDPLLAMLNPPVVGTPVATAAEPPPTAPAPAPARETAVLPPADLTAMQERLNRLEHNGADAASVLRLVDRIDRLEAGLRALENRRKGDAAPLLAITLLKEAVDKGGAFDLELHSLKLLAPDDAEVDAAVTRLRPLAASGIPALDTLTSRLHGLDGAIIRAEWMPADTEDGLTGWRRRVLERLMQVVTLRREDGEAEGTNAPAILARAEADLARADLADAVREMQGLSTQAAAIAKPWTNDAQARLDADRILSGLAAQAIASAGAKL